jgi:hypothetical protein
MTARLGSKLGKNILSQKKIGVIGSGTAKQIGENLLMLADFIVISPSAASDSLDWPAGFTYSPRSAQEKILSRTVNFSAPGERNPGERNRHAD